MMYMLPQKAIDAMDKVLPWLSYENGEPQLRDDAPDDVRKAYEYAKSVKFPSEIEDLYWIILELSIKLFTFLKEQWTWTSSMLMRFLQRI